MAQVVDSTNVQQFYETGKVDDFKAPEAEKPADEPVKEVTAEVDDKAEKSEDDDSDLPERVRQQIGKKHRAMKEAEEFAEREYNQRRAAEKRADQLEQQLAEFQQKSRPAVEEAKEPQQSDFETVQAYIDAVVNYKADQRIQKEKAEAEQRTSADNAKKAIEAFESRLSDFKKATPDFEAVTSGADITLPEYANQYIIESDQGAALGYELSKLYHDDRAELNRLLKLSPIRMIAELGKMEAKLEKPAAKRTEPAVSKAPAPITPIEGKTAPVNTDLNRNMSFAEYKRLKASQTSGKR